MSMLVDDDTPYGTYSPDFFQSLVLWLARHTLLGRGRARSKLRHALLKYSELPIDGSLFGLPMRCYLRGNLCEWKAFIKPSAFDPIERKVISDALRRPNAILVDVGANSGVIALAAVSIARPDARVIAIEPHPVSYRRLAFNLGKSGHPGALAIHAAIGDEDTDVDLAGEDLSVVAVNRMGNGHGFKVRMRCLHGLLQENNVDHIDLLKVDVEGYEGEVFSAFLSTAPRRLYPAVIIIEHLARMTWSFDCIGALKKCGYEVTNIAGNNTILKRKFD